jgi:hypothetical protein
VTNREAMQREIAAAIHALTKAQEADPIAVLTRMTPGDLVRVAFWQATVRFIDLIDEDAARTMLTEIRLLALRVMPQQEVN